MRLPTNLAYFSPINVLSPLSKAFKKIVKDLKTSSVHSKSLLCNLVFAKITVLTPHLRISIFTLLKITSDTSRNLSKAIDES